MTRVVGSIASAAVLASIMAATAGAQAFEGEIQMRLSGVKPGDPPRSMAYATRRGAVRLTVPGAPGGVVLLMPAGESRLYLLLPAQQSYIESPVPASPKATAQATPAITKTGRTETIAGVSCEHMTVTLPTGTGDVCLTKALGPWFNPLRMAAASAVGSAGAAMTTFEQVLNDGAFPLKAVLPDGTVSMEVTRIERKRLPPALFEVPPAYVKMTPPARR